MAGCDLRAAQRQPPMGARANADIIAIAPIDQVVPGFAARPCMVRDLVGRQPGFAHTQLGELVERPGAVVIGDGEGAAGMRGMKSRALLDGELIEREVVAGER